MSCPLSAFPPSCPVGCREARGARPCLAFHDRYSPLPASGKDTSLRMIVTIFSSLAFLARCFCCQHVRSSRTAAALSTARPRFSFHSRRTSGPLAPGSRQDHHRLLRQLAVVRPQRPRVPGEHGLHQDHPRQLRVFSDHRGGGHLRHGRLGRRRHPLRTLRREPVLPRDHTF